MKVEEIRLKIQFENSLECLTDNFNLGHQVDITLDLEEVIKTAQNWLDYRRKNSHEAQVS